MIKNMTVTVTFSNNQVRVWGYDTSYFESEETFLANVTKDFEDELKNVLYTNITMLREDDSIENFTLGNDVDSANYAEIIESHVNGSNSFIS